MRYLLAIVLLAIVGVAGKAQEAQGTLSIDGEIYGFTIDECGDTVVMARMMDSVSISSTRSFANADDFRKYRRYRRYAMDVYPYAAEAIRIFREVEYAAEYMSKRQERRYIRKLKRDLKDEFSDQLKDLTKTQGMILFKMIEKELDTPMYYLIKDLRNGLTATYWSTVGKLFGHQLKDGYVRGADEILDMVLDDIDVSYEIPYEDRERIRKEVID